MKDPSNLSRESTSLQTRGSPRKSIYLDIDSLEDKIQCEIQTKEKLDNRVVRLHNWKGFTKLFGNVDICTKYANKYVEVKSEDNDSDLKTNNLSGHFHSKHSEKPIKSKFQAL